MSGGTVVEPLARPTERPAPSIEPRFRWTPILVTLLAIGA